MTAKVKKPQEVTKAVLRNGGSIRNGKGSHCNVYAPDGKYLGTLSQHGELGPKASSAWTKVLIAAGLLTSFVCGLIAIAHSV